MEITYYLYSYAVITGYSADPRQIAEETQRRCFFVEEIVKKFVHLLKDKATERENFYTQNLPEPLLPPHENRPYKMECVYHAELAVTSDVFWEVFCLRLHDTYVIKALYRIQAESLAMGWDLLAQTRKEYFDIYEGYPRHYFLLGHNEMLTVAAGFPCGEKAEEKAREFYRYLDSDTRDPLRTEEPYGHLFYVRPEQPWLFLYHPEKVHQANLFLAEPFTHLGWCYYKIESQIAVWEADYRPQGRQSDLAVADIIKNLKVIDSESRLKGIKKVRALNKCLQNLSDGYLRYAEILALGQESLLGIETNQAGFERILEYHELMRGHEQIFTALSRDIQRRRRYIMTSLQKDREAMRRIEIILNTFQARIESARSDITHRTNFLIQIFGVLIAVIALMIGVLEVAANLPSVQQWLIGLWGGK